MSTEQAASLINTIKPLIAIPMHYEISKDKAKNFKQLVNEDVRVEIIQD